MTHKKPKMESILNNINDGFSQMQTWELIAVVLAIAYLLLIMRENSLGWICAFISTAIYIALFWKVSLLMESALNVYYMGMAIYGWMQWRKNNQQQSIAIVKWPLKNHALALLAIFFATLISGYLLSSNTQAAWPYLDSLTTWASVFTTYMVAKKVLENWLYWIVIDSIALYLYIDRELYLTALLFIAYLVICVFGYLNWKKSFNGYEHANA